MDSITDAQQDMREAYYGGAPGVITSGMVWLAAALVSLVASPKEGIVALIVGGMLIFPISLVFCKLIGVSGKHNKANPLASLAFENTFWMLVSIPIAVGAAFYKLEWFFPAMMFVIGGRYLTFSTLYGRRIYWLLAGVLIVSGWIMLTTKAQVSTAALVGGGIELVFGVIIFTAHKTVALPGK